MHKKQRDISINLKYVFVYFAPPKNFAAQMAGGFDEKAGGGAQMGVMQGPMVSKYRDPFLFY